MRSKLLIAAAFTGLSLAYLVSVIGAHFELYWNAPAQPQTITFAGINPAVSKPIVKQYSRIRLKTDQELDESYRLLVEFLKRPSLGHSVREFVLDRSYRRGGCRLCGEEDEEDAVSNHFQKSSDHSLVVNALGRLGLEDKIKDYFTIALAWKGWCLSSPASSSPIKDRRRTSSLGREKDAQFAHSVTALLLWLSPNLEMLQLQEIPARLPLASFLLKASYGFLSFPFLARLRTLHLTQDQGSPYSDERYYVRHDIIGTLRMFHRLPAIESITVDAICDDPNGSTVLPPHISGIRNIHIGHSDLSSASLAAIIRLPIALHEFSFSVGGRATEDGGLAMMLPKTLGKALLSQNLSLRKLDLDVDAYIGHAREEEEDIGDAYYPEWEEEELSWQRDEYWEIDLAASKGPIYTRHLPDTRKYGTSIGSLDDFEALTHLSIGVGLLLGSSSSTPFRLLNALPQSLEFLCIRGYKPGKNAEHDSHVEELLWGKAEKLPNLREVQGVEEEVPSARILINADENYSRLWTEEIMDDGWLEVATK